MAPISTTRFLELEARGLLTRLERALPFSVTMPAVAAASVSKAALAAIDRHLAQQRRNLRRKVFGLLRWLDQPQGRLAEDSQKQQKFTLLRLEFNSTLDQLDIFADALTQRSEHGLGVWLAGLDALAEEALALPGGFFDSPPLVTYVDRGHGAAIRRARTRLPGGASNPVTVIRVPRERLVGSGIGSSLIHEVGHQAAALLGLVESMRQALRARQQRGAAERPAWDLWSRWISEIVADFWSVGHIGIAATLGLMAVVSLPRAFVFRVSLDDPHPFPWIRVRLSCALGGAAYPGPQWRHLLRIWRSAYPPEKEASAKQALIALLEETLPEFVQLLIHHRPPSLRGRSVGQVMPLQSRQPRQLQERFLMWKRRPGRMHRAPPSLAVAVLGQARWDGRISPEQESQALAGLLTRWAVQRALAPGSMAGRQLNTLLAGQLHI
ncbi:MAG: hypothetical protein V3T83_08950 [Acidobacteriota bacterium]